MRSLFSSISVPAMVLFAGCGSAPPMTMSSLEVRDAAISASGLFPRPEEALVRKALLKVPGNKSVRSVRLTRSAQGRWTWKAVVRVTNIGAGPYTLEQPWSGELSWQTGFVTARYDVAAPGDRPGPGPLVHQAIRDL